MGKISLVYRNVTIYRIVMNILYTFGYRKRLDLVKQRLAQIKPGSVLELCFGDTLLAAYCKRNNISWHGIDANPYFVNAAVKRGFGAVQEDLSARAALPVADVVVMTGSLYHFHANVTGMLKKMLDAAKMEVIISEPVKNLSSQGGVLGFIAKRSANAGKGEEDFRYNESTFMKMLEEKSAELGFTSSVLGRYKKDIIVSLSKK
jgi:hypothetical protein